MTRNSEDWQSRTRLLIGDAAAERLFGSRVTVVGLGGVGGIAAEMLARAGIGSMTVIDGDAFDATNRNRQIGALSSTAGRAKTEVMAERLRDVNPAIRLNAVRTYLNAGDIAEIIGANPCDCLLDAIDSLTPKVELLRYCIENQIPGVSCRGSGSRMDPELVRCADISETKYCPLARAVRRELRKKGIEKGLSVIFSPETPAEGSVTDFHSESVPNKRSVTGTISYMPAVFGCHCAAAVIRKLISGCGGTCRPDCV